MVYGLRGLGFRVYRGLWFRERGSTKDSVKVSIRTLQRLLQRY